MIHRPIRYYYLKIVRQRDSPEQIAAGIALGVFVGLTVPPGAHMIIALVAATFLGFNRITAMGATWITNPLTIPIIYPIQLFIGSKITGIPFRGMFPKHWEDAWTFIRHLHNSERALLALIVGALTTAIPLTIASYYVTRDTVRSYRARKLRRAALAAAS